MDSPLGLLKLLILGLDGPKLKNFAACVIVLFVIVRVNSRVVSFSSCNVSSISQGAREWKRILGPSKEPQGWSESSRSSHKEEREETSSASSKSRELQDGSFRRSRSALELSGI